jgi:hypothetical protein
MGWEALFLLRLYMTWLFLDNVSGISQKGEYLRVFKGKIENFVRGQIRGHLV